MQWSEGRKSQHNQWTEPLTNLKSHSSLTNRSIPSAHCYRTNWCITAKWPLCKGCDLSEFASIAGSCLFETEKSKFCPGGKCRIAHYNRGPQRADAEYQFERRILRLHKKLTPKRFGKVVRLRLANIKLSKLEHTQKRSRSRFLQDLLNAGGK